MHEYPRRTRHSCVSGSSVRFADEPTIWELIVQLNHLHLCVPDVAAASAFFVDHFAFQLREMRGHNGFAILDGDGGMVLALMRLTHDTPVEHAYPPMFHVGFLVRDEAILDTMHASLVADGHSPSAVEHMRGARRFYCKAQGGLLVEVGHEPEATSA